MQKRNKYLTLISGGDCSKSNRRDEEKYLVQKEKEKSLTVQRKANEIGGRDYFLSIILFLVKDDGCSTDFLIKFWAKICKLNQDYGLKSNEIKK